MLLLQPGIGSAGDTAALRARAYELAYNLEHDAAVAKFREALAIDPDDAAAHRGIAAITWLNITIFVRGSATVDDYVSRITQPNVGVKPPPPRLAAVFHEHASRALALAERRVAAAPSDAAARYELGAVVGVQSSYQAVVEGRLLGAFRTARRAYNEHEAVLRLDPGRKDAGLIVGSYRYVVSALSLPMRWMAYAAGFGGGRERGLRMVEEAAAHPGEAQTDARFLLILLYTRERRYDDALRTIGELQRQYPRNRLLWLNAGATALRAARPADAEAALTAGLAMLEADRRPRVFGEVALWRYKRGAARVALGRAADAHADLAMAVGADARDWIRGRAHLELGKLADMAGDRDRARTEYTRGLHLCRGDSDPEGTTQARRLLERGFGR